MLTRTIGKTETAATMSIYIQMTFIIVCIGMGLVFGGGGFATSTDPSLEFLFRAWGWPQVADYPILLAVGICSAFGGFFISQAYRSAEAGLVAPFEYLALPLSIFWGVLVFDEWPDNVAFAGMALILGSGLYMIWREAQVGRAAASEAQIRR